VPYITYCSSVWYSPGRAYGTKGRDERAVQVVTKVQRRAAQIIAGAWRITAGPALDLEMHLMPAKQQLEKSIYTSLLRVLGYLRRNEAVYSHLM